MDFFSYFDTRTTALLVVIAFFIQANAIGAQAYLIREYEGVGIALLGNLSMAAGFSLLVLRGILPDFFTVIIANTLILTSPNLYYIAVSRFTGQAYSKRFIIVIIALTVGLLSIFLYFNNNVGARIIIVSIGGALSTLMIIFTAWKSRHVSYRFSMGLAVIPFCVYSLFLIARAIFTAFNPPQSIFSNSTAESVAYILLFIISFLWTIGFMLMFSQRLQGDLSELANTDTLTKIPSRYAAQSFLEKEFSRSQRTGVEFSILLIDFDNFKQLNDKYGHATGDLALITTAKMFDTAIRKQDIVGRWGGEEFLIVLPDTSIPNAQALAERLRKGIPPVEVKNNQLHFTVSIGVASSTGCGSIDEILKKADDALYVAKATKDAIATAK